MKKIKIMLELKNGERFDFGEMLAPECFEMNELFLLIVAEYIRKYGEDFIRIVNLFSGYDVEDCRWVIVEEEV